MDINTKLRTVLRIATSLNTAVMVTTAMIGELGITKLVFIWGIISIACDFVVGFITTYYNNDYTPEAQAGTKLTRTMKNMADYKADIVPEPSDAGGDADDYR